MEFKSGTGIQHGFHMTFDNGLTASVQWGTGTYTDNHFSSMFADNSTSTTAEVAVIGTSGKLIDLEPFLPEDCYADDVVCGYLSPNEVVEFLVKVKDYDAV